MTTELRTLDDLDVDGRRVLLRADLDVPLTPPATGLPARVVDDARIRAALPTIDELLRRGARLVLMSHLHRPDGVDSEVSMRPVVERLTALTGASVRLAPAVTGRRVRELTMGLAPGQMLMLENLRLELGEARNDPALASALAELADLYVGDAFAEAQHAYASTWGVSQRLPSAAGRLVERELHALDAVVERPARPLAAILGGAGLSGQLGAFRRLLESADVVCVGGATCLPFLAALGHPVGSSPCSREEVKLASALLAASPRAARHLALPSDLVVAWPGDGRRAIARPFDGLEIPDGWSALDIGPETAADYARDIAAARTVLWHGPMGRADLPRFAAGTHAVADAVATATAATVVGGRDTVDAVRRFKLEGWVSHVSSGGASMLDFIAGRELPGVQALLRHGRAVAERRMGRPSAVTQNA